MHMMRDRTPDSPDVVLPPIVESWYFVCRSRDLRRGRTLAWSLPSVPLVLYRGASGQAHALAAHCAHMGTHLVHGDVIDDRLRCPMHHWMHDGTYPVVERDGGVFVFVANTCGEPPLFPLPTWSHGSSDAPWRVAIGRHVRIATPWHACAMNGFDVVHFETVHQRELREPATVTTIGDHGIELRYRSRVKGQSRADRLMRWLATDHVGVTITCWGGNVFLVRSEAGSFVNHLMLCLTPTETDLIVTPLVAVPRTRVPGPDWLRSSVTAWLFMSFLGRDLRPLSGMQLRPDAALDHEGPLATFVRWLAVRPEVNRYPTRATVRTCSSQPHCHSPAT